MMCSSASRSSLQPITTFRTPSYNNASHEQEYERWKKEKRKKQKRAGGKHVWTRTPMINKARKRRAERQTPQPEGGAVTLWMVSIIIHRSANYISWCADTHLYCYALDYARRVFFARESWFIFFIFFTPPIISTRVQVAQQKWCWGCVALDTCLFDGGGDHDPLDATVEVRLQLLLGQEFSLSRTDPDEKEDAQKEREQI